MCFILSIDFLYSLQNGNAGAGICCLLLIAIALCDEVPILAGILLSFAMIKPQVALPVAAAYCYFGLYIRFFMKMVLKKVSVQAELIPLTAMTCYDAGIIICGIIIVLFGYGIKDEKDKD